MSHAAILTADLPNHGVEYGRLALANGKKLPLEVLRSNAGYYLGTMTENGPFTRESVQYFRKEEQAQHALTNGLWTQKEYL